MAVSGRVRLLIEAVLFGGATIALFAAGLMTIGIVFAGVVTVHYAASYDRVVRLTRNT